MAFEHHDDHDHDHPEPASSSKDLELPPFDLLWRGVALAVLALVLLGGAVRVVRVTFFLAPVALVLAGIAFLSGWGATVHLTGGEKSDDHPWV